MSFVVLALLIVAFLLAVGLCSRKDPPDEPKTTSKTRRAYVLGVNYGGENASDDEGCWKDVADYASALARSRVFDEHEVFKYVDDRAEGKHYTSKIGIQKLLAKISARSLRGDVDLVYVHFCGRGSTDGIETSDRQVVPADWLVRWALSFDRKTRVVATFDCHFDAKLPRLPEVAATFVSAESITHALVDVVANNPKLLDDTSDLCMHVWDYVGACPRTTSTRDVLKDRSFMPARQA